MSRVLNARVKRCRHRDTIADVTPDGEGCGECLSAGDDWVHLRLCMTCGAVRCCDSSPNRHASAHARSAGHPIARSLEPGENWMWCYVDEVLIEPR